MYPPRISTGEWTPEIIRVTPIKRANTAKRYPTFLFTKKSATAKPAKTVAWLEGKAYPLSINNGWTLVNSTKGRGACMIFFSMKEIPHASATGIATIMAFLLFF